MSCTLETSSRATAFLSYISAKPGSELLNAFAFASAFFLILSLLEIESSEPELDELLELLLRDDPLSIEQSEH